MKTDTEKAEVSCAKAAFIALLILFFTPAFVQAIILSINEWARIFQLTFR